MHIHVVAVVGPTDTGIRDPTRRSLTTSFTPPGTRPGPTSGDISWRHPAPSPSPPQHARPCPHWLPSPPRRPAAVPPPSGPQVRAAQRRPGNWRPSPTSTSARSRSSSRSTATRSARPGPSAWPTTPRPSSPADAPRWRRAARSPSGASPPTKQAPTSSRREPPIRPPAKSARARCDSERAGPGRHRDHVGRLPQPPRPLCAVTWARSLASSPELTYPCPSIALTAVVRSSVRRGHHSRSQCRSSRTGRSHSIGYLDRAGDRADAAAGMATWTVQLLRPTRQNKVKPARPRPKSSPTSRVALARQELKGRVQTSTMVSLREARRNCKARNYRSHCTWSPGWYTIRSTRSVGA